MAENVTNLPIYCTARIPEFFFLKHRELPGYFTFVSPIPFTEPKINHSVWSLAPRPASQTVCVKILLKDRTTYHFNIYFFPSKPKSSITIKQAGSVRRFKAQWIILRFFFFLTVGQYILSDNRFHQSVGPQGKAGLTITEHTWGRSPSRSKVKQANQQNQG